MMEWTDRHCRVFHRQLTRHALLTTEMVDDNIWGIKQQLCSENVLKSATLAQLKLLQEDVVNWVARRQVANFAFFVL